MSPDHVSPDHASHDRVCHDRDATLIAATLDGDLNAFGCVVDRYSGRLLRYISVIVGDEHDAEDVAQRAFANAFEKLDQYDQSKSSFSTWLFRIGRNLATNYLRSKGRSPVRFGTPVPDLWLHHDPSERLEWAERFSALDRALAELPLEQRSAWQLSELENLSQDAIAEIENVPVGTVKSRVARAKQTLKTKLAAQWKEEQ